MIRWSSNRRVVAVFLAAAVLLAPSGGCVQRRLTLRSNPSGARVYVGDQEIGTTPVSTDFVYYGTRKIRLVKDGYETLVVNQPIPAPWYQYFPLDFVTENVLPGEIRDERVVNFQLTPLVVQPSEPLLSRAENLRQTGRFQAITPAPASGANAPPPAGMVPPGTAAPVETLPLPGPQTTPAGPAGGPLFGPPPANRVPPAYNPPQYLPPG